MGEHRRGRNPSLIRRGDIRLVDLDPGRGQEADNRRPVVIVSNDGANATASRHGHGVVTVVPVTSSIDRIYPLQVLLPAAVTGLVRDFKAQAEQVRSVTVERVTGYIGTLPNLLVSELDDALRLHLDL
jgi:mRNA interferase MazF